VEKIIKMDDFKLYALNIGAFTISLTNIADVLKIILLVVSIGYTAVKWFKLMQNDKTIDKDD
tara:strand:+ start:2372 stop:2557 length:186 start_codon:yes stop_codon:yes gene_type:complete